MSDIRVPSASPGEAWSERDCLRHLEPDARELLLLASQLGPRDNRALACIIRRAREICESEGEEVALAVIEQVQAIVSGRGMDA
ncbi:hypothetical protein [Phenylobacterium koreense]|uniref:Uncharacterized protein n=1 Tax=Phenylobacterium koreense TaxID=266125 RepID=A0ABV2EMS3_9CAUL